MKKRNQSGRNLITKNCMTEPFPTPATSCLTWKNVTMIIHWYAINEPLKCEEKDFKR